MDNLTENGRGTANAAEAESVEEVAADLGKFRDVKALISAYKSLEAEFTRRSQRLKELEEGQSKAEAAAAAADEPKPSAAHTDEQFLYEAAAANAAVRERIIGDYLKAVANGRGAPFVTGGTGVRSPVNRPATIAEAGRLAEQFLNGGK